LRDDQVDLAGLQRRDQLVARHGHHDDVDLEVAGLARLVQLLIEAREVFVGEAARRALVDEEEGPVERYAGADQTPRHHGVEVAGERVVNLAAHILGQGRVLVRALSIGRRRGTARTPARHEDCGDEHQDEE